MTRAEVSRQYGRGFKVSSDGSYDVSRYVDDGDHYRDVDLKFSKPGRRLREISLSTEGTGVCERLNAKLHKEYGKVFDFDLVAEHSFAAWKLPDGSGYVSFTGYYSPGGDGVTCWKKYTVDRP